MSMTRIAAGMLSMGAMLLGWGVAWGQNYPNKPIRILTSEVGGGNDFVARLIAPAISGPLGQQVIIDNRAGIIAIETTSKAQPDGYTLLINGSIIWVEPLLRDNVPWNSIKDFSPITLAATSPSILVIHPALAANSVKELIILAKAKPGELNYASGAAGTAAHTAAELFKAMAGVRIVRVPYKGSGPAVLGLIGGQVQLMFAPTPSVSTHVKSGKLRALAITSAQPSALLPGLPTIAASGLPGYQSVILYAVLAPAGTPPAPVRRLNQEIVQVVNRPDVKERFFNAGLENVGNSPSQLLAMMQSEVATLSKVIKEAGIRGD